MKLGFLFNTFHSEVLDFLLELTENKDDIDEIIVYNDNDNYQNMDIYKRKYSNFSIKSMNEFLHDTVNNVYDKIIVLTYSNLFSLSFIENYKDKFIFIAHSEKDLKQLEEKNFKYVTLTHLLSSKGNGESFNKNTNWMLPVTKKTTEEEHYNLKNVNDLEDNELYNKRKLYIKEKNLTPIMMIGHFMYNNKNLDIIKELLNTKGVYLFIFAPDITNCLHELKGYNNFVFCGVRWKTAEIEKMIIKYDIKHVLFAPSEKSDFWQSQWSGTLCYALSRSMNLILPYQIAKNYKLENTMTTYEKVDDINDDFIKSLNHKKEMVEEWRQSNYKRNEKILEMVLSGKKITDDDNLFEYIFEEPITDNILYINSGEGHDISWLLKNKECKIKSCESVLEIAKQQKEKMMLYGLLERIKIYNNKIGLDIRNGDIQIDNLDTDNIDMIIIKNENDTRQIEILKTGLKFINDKKPKIIMINDEFTEKEIIDKIKREVLSNYNYTMKKVIREEKEIYITQWNV